MPNPIIIQSPQNKSVLDKGLDYGVKGGLIIGGFILLRKIYRDFRKNEEEKNMDKKPETRQAMSLRSAMNPSGISWLMSMDTTNTTSLFDTAKQITNIEEVRQAYKNLYNSDLWDDLKSELSASDFERFTKTAQFTSSKVKGNTNSLFNLKAGYIVTAKEGNLRKTPKMSAYVLSVVPFSDYMNKKISNIFLTAKANRYLGVFDGGKDDTAMDTENNVLFIRVRTTSKDGKEIKYWVARSVVNIIESRDEIIDKNGKLKPGITKVEILSSSLSGNSFSGITGYENFVVSNTLTPVLDAQLRKVGMAKPEMLIGIFTGDRISDNSGLNLLKVRTVQGNERWVNKNDVNIQ